MSTQCHVGSIINTLDARQEAHVEGYLLEQQFATAAKVLGRHRGSEVRWQDLRKHVYRSCGCWGTEARLDLRPSHTVAKSYDDVGDQSRQIYRLLLDKATSDPRVVKQKFAEVSAARHAGWPDPIAYFDGGRQWVLEATGLSVPKWKSLYEWFRSEQLVSQVGRGYGTGYLLFPVSGALLFPEQK